MSLLYSVLCTFEQQVKIFLKFGPVMVHLLPSRFVNYSTTFRLSFFLCPSTHSNSLCNTGWECEQSTWRRTEFKLKKPHIS